MGPGARAAGILTQGAVSAIAPVPTSVTASLLAQQQSAAVAVQAQNQLSRITTALQAMQNLQSAARNLAFTQPNSVPAGLQLGGLVPDSGLAAPGVANAVHWTGAQTPTQAVSGGKTTVTINQTAAQAILSWNSFNVSPATTVDFNQQGNTDWVALNQISNTGSPAAILGSIKASGQIYLIDPNGIIFGGTSQVNVGALIASSADPSDSTFPFNTAGIYTTPTSFSGAAGAITVAPGALIATNTPASVTEGGGYVLLLGTTVSNGGDISTPDGQTEMAAGDDFALRQGYGTENGNTSSTTRGNEIAVTLNAPGSSLTGGSGLVVNTGYVTADTGDITLAGETVRQDGVLLSTTSVSVRGTIHLLSSASDPDSSVTVGSNGYTLVEPDLSSTATELDSERAALIASSTAANLVRGQQVDAQFNDLSLLPDQQEDSRIEIVTGGTAEFAGGSDTSAPGGQIAVSAAAKVQVDDGAVLDVSGSYGVTEPMSANAIAVNIQDFELRDDPQNRLAGGLVNANVYVDARTLSLVPASAADASDRDYTAGGLLEVSGYAANIEHTIGEYTALGGSIDLAAGSDGAIVAQAGATFDIDGGAIQYQGGELPQSYLVGSDGHIYNVNTAPADVTYTGVYGDYEVTHPNWGVTQTYAAALGAPDEVYQPGYIEGRAAGSLTLSAPTTIFDGTVQAGAVNGPLQTNADPAGVSDAYLLTQNEVAEPGALNIAQLNESGLIPADTDVTFAASAPAAGSLTAPIAADLEGTTVIGAAALNSFGLGGLTVITDGSVAVTAPVVLAAGGDVALYGSSVDFGADVTAPGGSVSAGQVVTIGSTQYTLALQNPAAGEDATGDTALAAGVEISTAGLFTNLEADPDITFTEAFANGGAVSLGSVNNLTLDAGSVIDSSAGGVVSATGTAKGGAGGAITLAAATPSNAITTPTGDLTLDGTLDAVGATQGGALTLSAPAFLITAAAPSVADPAVVTLDPAFFAQGFSAYNLESTGDITVAPGTDLAITEPTYQVFEANDLTATGAAPASVFPVALDPLYTVNDTYTAITQRPGASFSATIALLSGENGTETGPDAPAVTIGAGASISVDPGQAIKLAGTGQITIDGTLDAPGGVIAAVSDFNTFASLPRGPGTISIWLGAQAVLDASAIPVSFEDPEGAVVSLAPAGGTIMLGSAGSAASVIINPGALVEASGSAAADVIVASGSALAAAGNSALPVGQAVPVEGAGGAISLASQSGIYNDGSLIAAEGGPAAAGGSLSMTLEADEVLNSGGTQEMTPRLFTITQNTAAPTLPAGLQPGQANAALASGTATLSAQQIEEGGFGSVTLFTRDAFIFDGDVSLSAKQSISLEEGYLTDSSAGGSVTLSAPYVLLSGQTLETNAEGVYLAVNTAYSAQSGTGAFTVDAGDIEIANQVGFGDVLPAAGRRGPTDLAGFGTVNLDSGGDLLFEAPTAVNTSAATNLVTAADVNLTASEIVAVGGTRAQALVAAGYDPVAGSPTGAFNPAGTLTIATTPGTTPAPPDQVGGSLTFEAATVLQGGVIWQPLGQVTFGSINQYIGESVPGGGDPKAAVVFLPGSVTSVSAAGLSIPYGGTTDGVTYEVSGAPVSAANGATFGLESVTNGTGPGTITVAALNIDVQNGATLDLAGGGALTGAGFISGEEGSTDVLSAPLLNVGANGVTQPGLASEPVYAIVAGAQPVTASAYTETGATGSVPGLGASIVIPAGVPGLAAGRYTLLPASYALEPGGYRVQIDGAAGLTAAAVSALGDGSYQVAGFTARAGTNVQATLPSALIITPGAAVLHDGQYDQESYSQYLVADAALFGAVREVLPADAGTLVLNLPASSLVSLTDAGTALFGAAAGGEGGTLEIAGAPLGTGTVFDIYGAAPVSGLAAGTVSLAAAQIDEFGASTLEIGVAGKGINAASDGITLENGAVLTAARVVLTATGGGITLNDGAVIDTLGQGTLLADSTELGLFSNQGAGVLDVGNGYLSYATTPPDAGTGYGPITVADGATIYTDGSIAFSTGAAVDIGVNAVYGAKYLDLDVPEINVGDPAAAGAAAPSGLLLTPSVLTALTAGVKGLGVPAAEIVNLTATDSLNFYGTTALDLSGADVQLVINTPAIYGFGGAGDVATISAQTIVWSGLTTVDSLTGETVSLAPGGTSPAGQGSGGGTLDLDAGTVIFGYSDLALPQRDVTVNRLAAGFAFVNVNATTEITGNNQGTLAVYQTVPDYGQAGSGGTLTLTAPLLTAADAAVIGFTAGGAIKVVPAAGEAAATALASPAAGGEVDLTAQDVAISGAVILPSGKLDVQAAGSIDMSAGALVDLAGETTANFDQTVDGFGGDLVLASAAGNITQEAGSVIDVGAKANNAGSVTVSAAGAGAGQVALLGTLKGGADAGYEDGSITITAQSVGDFAALNQSLDVGRFFQSRSFDIKQGDLTIGDGVQAHNVSVSADGGSLVVTGLIDASGGGGGEIDLAAADGLTIAGGAALDAQGTVLQVDGYGQVIDAENAPVINLTASGGELTLDTGAQFDLASADGVARGDLELNVPRLTSATSGDANISAADGVAIDGAAVIAVNAFWTYHGKNDPNGGVDGAPDALITQAYLDHINTDDTQPFMTAAAANADLAARLAGLSGYGSAFHFRPGVEIESAAPDGDLTVQGDLDLLGYRYGPDVVAGDPGTGEPGVLEIRAGGNLNIYGSITDGFDDPVSDKHTEFAEGWLIFGGGEPYDQNQVTPAAIAILKGSSFTDNAPVNFAVAITGGTFEAGAVAPVALTLSVAQTVTVAFVATSAISVGGTTLFAAGQVVPAGAVLPDGAVIGAGGTLPFAVTVGKVTWPANTPFTVTTSISGGTGVVLETGMTLLPGAFIPAGSALKFDPSDPGYQRVKSSQVVDTRPVSGGTQGQLYALGTQLPAGDMSWSIDLVAGADTKAAGADVVQTAAALAASGAGGDLTLADTHYGLGVSGSDRLAVVPAFSVVRTGTGSLSLVAGGSIDEDSSFGVYTAGTQSSAILNADGQNAYDLAQGYGTDTSLLGADNTAEAALVANYAANYSTGGGNVLIAAQGDVNGFVNDDEAPDESNLGQFELTDSDAEGGWLWRQGGAGQPAAWWIEYGSLNLTTGAGQNNTPDSVQYTGFQGFGTLGGGNLTVSAGGDASQLNLAVGSSGRVLASGALVQDGGGALSVTIGGGLNFVTPGSFFPYSGDGGGLISDLRGDATVTAGSVGTILPAYQTLAGTDPRFLPPLDYEAENANNGIDLLPGDGTVTVAARGDLVIDGASDPGIVQNTVNTTPVDFGGVDQPYGGSTNFALSTPQTAISLFSAGGDAAPDEYRELGTYSQNTAANDLYPASLSVIAQSGNIDLGDAVEGTTAIELAPSSDGELKLLAADSIFGDGATVSMSGAALSTVAAPSDPGIVVQTDGVTAYTNIDVDSPGLLIDFGADTPTGALHAGDAQPALVYAATGDIVDVAFGQLIPASGTLGQEVIAAKPFEIAAGRDIVQSGTIAAPDIFLNLAGSDVSSVTAGRDIVESSFDVAGPGNLTVQAGRDVYLLDQGVFDSIGPLFDIDPNDRNSGAGISVLAGVGADGPDYAGFENAFLNPDSTLSLEDASDIITANDAALYAWLVKTYGYTGQADGAYGYFVSLNQAQQEVFLRQLFFSELNESGLEFNESSSVRYKSYVLGKTAIAALFPAKSAGGQALSYAGNITMSDGSGIHTEFGGDIETLAPGGETVIGVEGVSPPASAGFITQGSGDIDIYSLDSVLLGESRVLTTFGGNIVIWSAAGDINAGRGSKTSIDYTPLQRVYDAFGDVFLSPTTPSSGAGIATLNPIPAVPPGDINLVAPLGTVDAGSAGIRVSGNLNIAAAHVANTANIQVQGSSTGVSAATSPDIGSLTSTSNAAGAAAQAAESTTAKPAAAALPSIWIVEILGYGGSGQPEPQKKKGGEKVSSAGAPRGGKEVALF